MRVIKAIYSNRVVYYYKVDGQVWFIRKWNDDQPIDHLCTSFASLKAVWNDKWCCPGSISYVSGQDEDFCVALLQSKVK